MTHVFSRPALFAILLSSSLPPLSGPSLLAQQNQRTVLVSVLGRNDAPVADLTVKDFAVREDGVTREIVRVAPAPPPGHLVLLVDDSQAATPFFRDMREALTVFANTMADEVPPPAIRLATFANRPTTRVDFTPVFSAVSRGIDRIAPTPGSGATFLDAIMETCRDLRTRKVEGAVIVAFIVESGAEFSDVLHQRVGEALKSVGAALWTISVPDRGGSGGGTNNRERAAVIGDVSPESGGYNKVALSAQSLTPAFRSVAAMLLSRYAVTYGRPDTLVPPARLEVSGRDRAWKLQVSRWPVR